MTTLVSKALTTGARALADHRRSPRSKVFLLTEVIVKGASLRVHILDLSVSGSKLHTPAAPLWDGRVYLVLNGELVAGIVVWSNADRFGLRFLAKISSERLANIVRS